MRKAFVAVLIVLVAMGALVTGVAFAQGAQPPQTPGAGYGPGPMANGQAGPLHTYLVEALAARLNLSVDTVSSALQNGSTMYQVALNNGVAATDIPTMLQEVRQSAFSKAEADGVMTQEQANWMLSRMQGAGNGDGTGNCPYFDGQPGQAGNRFGSGMMNGRGW